MNSVNGSGRGNGSGTDVGAAIVTATAVSRRRVESHFLALHAIGAEDAIEYAPPGPAERREFEALQARGVIRTAAPGNYWFDLSRLDAQDAARRRKWVPIVLSVAVGAAILALIFYRG
ncbi:hypothetical protein [Sphingomonas qomolangmaensis]|uniref:Helix-turn-helix domain-containing protein n=1 Tax=Sphingomonas qomolangmaensis TaxID=2918765 RepID=A0ABY5L3E8_9SPHN|nr:hypothetical protein [Sphingomonas qomolangmaensis]UUL81474.1 hypothetical protein NMP03_09635 [Sphingomonas qomolangmaensis]